MFVLLNETANAAIEVLDSRNLYRTLNLVKEQKNELNDMLENATEKSEQLKNGKINGALQFVKAPSRALPLNGALCLHAVDWPIRTFYHSVIRKSTKNRKSSTCPSETCH